MTKLKVIMVCDQDSYKTIFFNGKREFEDSDTVIIQDVLRAIQEHIEESGGVTEMVVDTFELYDASVSEIPQEVNTVESLEAWYRENFDTEISPGY
jgi:hypothetical protein